LLVLDSTVIHGSESHGTHDHILVLDGSGSLQTTFCWNTCTAYTNQAKVSVCKASGSVCDLALT
jgi:hypothetical protein